MYTKVSENGFRFPTLRNQTDGAVTGETRNLQDNNESDNSRNNRNDNHTSIMKKVKIIKDKNMKLHDKRDKTEQARIIKPIPVKNLETVNDEGKKKDSTEKSQESNNEEDTGHKGLTKNKDNDTESNENQRKENSGGSNKKDKKGNSQNDSPEQKENDIKVSSSIDENINILKDIFHLPVNQDVIIREFKIAREIEACVVFIDGMVDKVYYTISFPAYTLRFDGFSECLHRLPGKNVHQVVRMDNYQEIASAGAKRINCCIY